jgi:hypothetical protein
VFSVKQVLVTAICAGVCAGSAAAGSGWVYGSDIDQMTQKTTYEAFATSSNSLNLPFPYEGSNKAQLTVRQHPKHGLDVYVVIEKGQILCRSYDGCSIAVRFDDRPPITFEGAAAADHSSNVVFMRNEKRFISEAKKAKAVRIQLTMYQAGNQVLVFETPAPLEWPMASAAKK